MVKTRKGILRKAKLALRPMKLFGEPTRQHRLKLAELEVCPELQKKTLDSADDFIHGTYRDLFSSVRLIPSTLVDLAMAAA